MITNRNYSNKSRSRKSNIKLLLNLNHKKRLKKNQ